MLIKKILLQNKAVCYLLHYQDATLQQESPTGENPLAQATLSRI